MTRKALLISSLLLLAAPAARALPQFSVESAASCDTCHVRPSGWDNPEVRLRKCSLSCNACHVNPTGGGLKNAGGIHYGRRFLPLFGSKFEHAQLRFDERHLPANPMDAIDGQAVPAPNTPERFDGIRPNPFFQFGGDFRSMVYFAKLGERNPDDVYDETRFFPMQADIYLAIRPYNPVELNRGRLTLYASGGAVGQRFYGEDFAPDLESSLRVREVFALYDDLPRQLYVKAGRFIPAFGWRLDDHTAYIRQEQGFDNERWVEGVEVGLNPNYPFAHLSLYRIDPDRFTYYLDDNDKGHGGALSIGTRQLAWQLGASALFESRDQNDELMVGLHWGLNLLRARHPWKGLDFAPLTYMGEIDLRRVDPVAESADGGPLARNGLTMFHELNYLLRDGLRLMVRFDWQDIGLDVDATHRQRYTAGVIAHLFPYTELIAQYRHNAGFAETFVFPNPNKRHEALLQLHFWY